MNPTSGALPVKIGFGLIVAFSVAILGWAIVSLPTEAEGLTVAVHDKLDVAGASNPVTAVLLNFRGYDTLLEVTVLLLAVLGAHTMATSGSGDPAEPLGHARNSILIGMIRVIAPAMIVVAGYLLWVGGHAPGGAFQAGAVLAALGVLLLLGGVNWPRYLSRRAERLLLTAGLVIFIAVGLGSMAGNRRFLEYPLASAKWCILLIEAVATLSIAGILLALYCGGAIHGERPPREQSRQRSGK